MTFYQTLGVKENATQNEIKSSYKKLVKQYHPDIYKGDKDFALKKMQEINTAYDVLSDENKRREYNLSLMQSRNPNPNPNPNPNSNSRTNRDIENEYMYNFYKNASKRYGNEQKKENQIYDEKGRRDFFGFKLTDNQINLFIDIAFIVSLFSGNIVLILIIVIAKLMYDNGYNGNSNNK